MKATPRGLRLQIGLFGRRNVGKSSLLNALAGQEVAIVSPVAGTTTDPVEKAFELLPLGPVLFIDTAGLDDAGTLGAERTGRSRRVVERTDLALLVVTGGAWGDLEEEVVAGFAERGTPVIVVFNQCDREPPDEALAARLAARGLPVVRTAAVTGAGIDDLRAAIVAAVPGELLRPQALVGDLVRPGEAVVLVVPIDKEAPKGRLILPQVQAIRDLLDHDAWCLVVKDEALGAALAALREPPALVVTDSQAFRRVADQTPPEVPLTSFSILLARAKGDLAEMVRGAAAIDRLRPGDRVLIVDACSHHPIEEDIARVKIPAWLAERVGGPLATTHFQGRDWPADLATYRLVIHCGGCMLNRREMISRQARARAAGVPVTNFGLAIAWSLGLFERALGPFPDALAAWREMQ